jgi:hypothetical protein
MSAFGPKLQHRWLRPATTVWSAHVTKSELFTPNEMQYQQTSNINIVANFLNFSTVIPALQSCQLFKSYDL